MTFESLFGIKKLWWLIKVFVPCCKCLSIAGFIHGFNFVTKCSILKYININSKDKIEIMIMRLFLYLSSELNIYWVRNFFSLNPPFIIRMLYLTDNWHLCFIYKTGVHKQIKSNLHGLVLNVRYKIHHKLGGRTYIWDYTETQSKSFYQECYEIVRWWICCWMWQKKSHEFVLVKCIHNFIKISMRE